MLKYSTYISIYDQDPKNNSVNHLSTLNCRIVSSYFMDSVKSLSKQFRQLNLIKCLMIIMLIASGFTVVGNVFASSIAYVQQEKRIVVEPGDTLWSIAYEHKPSAMRTAVYIEGIKQHNGLNNSYLQAGDILSLPVY